MGLDRQFLVEILDAQGQRVAQLTASRINVVDSKVTGTTPGTASSIATYAGNGQSGTAGATIAIPPAVRVTDANGLPVAGSSVTWFHGGGSGTTSTGTVTTTNSNGVSQVGSWSLGTTAGSVYTLFAYSGNLTNSPIRFSCTPTAGSAFSISASRGTSQTTTPTGTMPSSLSACVHDQYGNPITGASVTVTTTDAEATIGSAALTTSSSGHAGTTYQVGQSASVASVLFAISSNTSARFPMTTVAGPATGITILTGDNQIGEVSSILALPVTVAIDDGYGNAISSGETLQFVVVQGSGSISRATATPTASQSSFTWAVGSTAGQNAVEISLENLSNSTVTVFASGTNPTADTIFVVSGVGQSATVNAALGAPLRFGVTGSGSSASGQIVDLTVTGNGSLSTSRTVSSTSGLVSFTATAGTVASRYTVTATATGLTGSPSQITFDAVAGSATSLIVQTQPTSNPVPGVAWPQQPVIITTDVFGNLVSTNTRVGIVLTSGDGTLASGVSMFAVASGATATFSGVSYTQVSSNAFQVAFRCNSLSTATGDQQTAQPPFAIQLGFSTQPTGAVEGQNIGTVIVAVQDSTGATVPTATDPVTLAIGTNPGGGTLSGTLTQTASGGLATFTGLSIDQSGTGYTLNATATGLTGATSAAFNITEPSTSHPNEPAGMTQLTNQPWDALPAIGTNDAYGWKRNTAGANVITTDATAPTSPSNVLRVNFNPSLNGGTAPEQIVYTISGTARKRLYLHFQIYVDPNWTNNGNTATKLLFFCQHDSKNHYVEFIAGASGTGQMFRCNTQHNDNGSLNANQPTSFQASASNKGRWLDVEIVLYTGTAGGADGTYDLWVDGTKRATRTGIQFFLTAQGSAVYWNTIYLNSTYGGGSNKPPQQLYFMIDNFYASASNS